MTALDLVEMWMSTAELARMMRMQVLEHTPLVSRLLQMQLRLSDAGGGANGNGRLALMLLYLRIAYYILQGPAPLKIDLV
jgi:hypothetical protein